MGALAKWVVPGSAPAGILGDIVVGILGALIGGWLFRLFGREGVTGFWNWHSWLCAVIGAVVLLWAARILTGRHRVT